jgi:hypothetical protein
VLKLGNLYRTRVLAHSDKDKRCAIFSAVEIADNWDRFTASQLANADKKETMEGYAHAYEGIAQQRVKDIQRVAHQTIDRVFPAGKLGLTPAQRAAVDARIDGVNRPAAILDDLYDALDAATGNKTASYQLRAAVAKQVNIGGYAPGETLRQSDEAEISEMWAKIHAFLQREYRGYPVDIASLMPAKPVITTTGETAFALGGEVTIGLKNPWNKASLYSTLLHETKHAIDQKSHAPVEGAAWEGAAVTIERQVWPMFIVEAMKDQASMLPISQLITAIDNVRFTATTDATLKVFLRKSCNPDEPDTVEYAQQIVAGYGYRDPAILSLRSKRAHASTQYLEYDYGLVMYMKLLDYLRLELKNAQVRVDAYLLQACGMPSPSRDKASVDKLAACIQSRL